MLAMTLSPAANLAADTQCPECARSLVRVSDAAPWCPACEWGLGDPGSKPPATFGWRWLDYRVFRLAYRVTRDEFRRLNGAPEVPSGHMRGSSLMVTVAALVIYATVAACLVAGIWLCTVRFPSPMLLPGVLLILLAVELRPRFGRLPRHVTVLDPGAAPELHRLVARVADAVGAPMPQVICLAESEFNASAGKIGLRRRRVLIIGVPLWEALGPQQRVALLGHELGHFVNGDPGRGLLVQPVYLSLATVVDLLRPVRNRFSGLIEMISEVLLSAVMAVIRWPLTGVWLGLVALGQRGGQLAEYRADVLSARAAGSEASVELFDVLMLSDPVFMLIKRDARAGVAPTAWHETAAGVLTGARPQLNVRRQASVRAEVDLFASHPPAGMRARLIEGRPAEPAAVVLDEATNARIEDELAKPAARCARTLKAQ